MTKNPFIVEVEDVPKTTKPEAVKEVAAAVKQPETVKEVVAPVVEKKVIKPVEMNPSSVRLNRTTAGEAELQGTRIQWGMFFAGVGTTLVVSGLAFGGWWMYSQRVALPPEPSPTPMAALVLPTPQPTPQAPVLSRSGIKVDVLNGTGEVGKAGSVATKIVALGYAKGTTGNADTQTGSVLSFSTDIATLSAQIAADIKTVVSNLTVSDKSLKGTGLVQVVIGK